MNTKARIMRLKQSYTQPVHWLTVCMVNLLNLIILTKYKLTNYLRTKHKGQASNRMSRYSMNMHKHDCLSLCERAHPTFVKAQMSLEAIVIFAIVLIIFTGVSLSALSWQMNSNTMNEFLENRQICSKVVNEVYSVFVFGNGSESIIKLDKGINMSNNTVYVGGVICNLCCNTTNGSSNDFDIQEGYLRLLNQGDILMENV